MEATDLLIVTMSRSVTLTGEAWWTPMLLLRLLVALLAGFSLFSDEQERFVCNTIQPGCSVVCFDAFSPVSALRLWLFHLVLLCVPHALFAAYVAHELPARPRVVGPTVGSRGGSTANSSREPSVHRDLPPDRTVPRFHCAYFLSVTVRILVEVAFGVGQFCLYGVSVPQSFLCSEAPCSSGIECYTSRPTEKTLLLNFLLGVTAVSVLLSLLDLLSAAKAAARQRRPRETVAEEELSSAFTTLTVSAGDESADEKPSDEPRLPRANGGAALQVTSSASEPRKDPLCSTWNDLEPAHFVLRCHGKPPLSPRRDRTTPLNPAVPRPSCVHHVDQSGPAGTSSDSSEAQETKAWV